MKCLWTSSPTVRIMMVVSWLGVGGQLLAKASKGPIGNYLSELEAQPGGPRGGQLKNRARSP
ncbi:hypothetical protein LBMAG52_16470 [Planctomycetia bacterium]|nr:hypothetical protein LBMAG52_16470 [Planctomycetia bacterium]